MAVEGTAGMMHAHQVWPGSCAIDVTNSRGVAARHVAEQEIGGDCRHERCCECAVAWNAGEARHAPQAASWLAVR